jgi:phosphoserine aminotransferase
VTRPFNFSPGPSALPEPVLRQAQEELLDWHGTGVSVMEMSHRGKHFMSVYEDAVATLRRVASIPDDYAVVFLQGGAIGQNALVPMNLLRGRPSADYVDTGHWAGRSIEEARKYGAVNVAASGRDSGYTAIPPRQTWRLDPGAAYVHICSNETIGGLEYAEPPDTGDVPLVADMSSSILSRRLDIRRYGCIYGGAQKNIGPAGLTIVIVRRDLLGAAMAITPQAFDYTVQAANDSMINTPPTFAIYLAGLVFHWLEEQGGLAAMEAVNARKAQLLYDCIDGSALYENRIAPADRSRMNVVFHLKDPSRDAAFLAGAEQGGLAGSQGAPRRRRNAGFDLQRHAFGGRSGIGRPHARLRAHAGLSMYSANIRNQTDGDVQMQATVADAGRSPCRSPSATRSD